MIGIIMITEPINQEFLDDLKLKHNVRLITQDLAPDLLIFEHDTIAEVFQPQIGGMIFDINYILNNYNQRDPREWKEMSKFMPKYNWKSYAIALFINDYCFSIIAGHGLYSAPRDGMDVANYTGFECMITTDKDQSIFYEDPYGYLSQDKILELIEEALPKDFFNK